MLITGLTLKGLLVEAPGFQVYVVPPVAVKAAVAPIQMAVGLALAPMVGLATTATACTAVDVQPNALVPITV